MADSQASSRRSQAAERAKQAFAMRIAGATYAQIGERLQVTTGAAHKMVRRVLDQTRQETAEAADELRRLEVERLDALTLLLWKQATGSKEPNHGAIDRLLRIMERRARLLGLDAPTRQELTGKDGGPVEVQDADAIRARLLARFTGGVANLAPGGESDAAESTHPGGN